MTRRRLELLQWFALFAGPWAWATQHVLAFAISNSECAIPVRGWNLPTWWLQILISAVVGTVVLAAEGAAYIVFRATQSVDSYAPGPEGRIHFFAQAALLGNVLFLVIVVLDVVGTLFNLPCRTG